MALTVTPHCLQGHRARYYEQEGGGGEEGFGGGETAVRERAGDQ